MPEPALKKLEPEKFVEFGQRAYMIELLHNFDVFPDQAVRAAELLVLVFYFFAERFYDAQRLAYIQVEFAFYIRYIAGRTPYVLRGRDRSGGG